MNPVGASDTARPVVGLGLTEGLASALAFALHRPPAGFDAVAPVIAVQNARVGGALAGTGA
jgi:zinc transporter ZupT